MTVLLTGCWLFAVAFAAHWLLWRFYLPRNHTVALLVIFALTPVFVLPVWHPPLWPMLHALLFYASAASAYVVLYSAIEEESPTLSLLSYLADGGGQGCDAAALEQKTVDADVVGRRLDAMQRTGLIREDGGECALTPKGQSLARLFALAASVIGLKRGG